jgi:hypothetical protein
MSEESKILQLALEAIRAGRLPTQDPQRKMGGSGFGATCTICSQRIKSDEAEFELEFGESNGNGNGNGNSGFGSHHLHIRCYSAWEFERHSYQNGESAVLKALALPETGEDGTITARENSTVRREPA